MWNLHSRQQRNPNIPLTIPVDSSKGREFGKNIRSAWGPCEDSERSGCVGRSVTATQSKSVLLVLMCDLEADYPPLILVELDTSRKLLVILSTGRNYVIEASIKLSAPSGIHK